MYQLNRFARNRYDSAIYKKQLKDRGIKVLSARELLTSNNINLIANKVVEKGGEKDLKNLRIIEKNIKDVEKRKTNLLKSISQCEDDEIRKELFLELSRITDKYKEYQVLKSQGESKQMLLNAIEIKYFSK